MEKIRIIIADDHELFVNGLCLLLADTPWVDVLDVAGDGRELLDILPRQVPDVVLMDINMPVMNGLDAIHYLRQDYPGVRVIILSTYNEGSLVEKAKRLGANGYLLKNSSKQQLLEALRLVTTGASCFPVKVQARKEVPVQEDSFLKRMNITPRELDVMRLIREGHTNQQIADKLVLSIYTVETHRKNLMQKLGLKTPAALMKFILENEL